MFGIKIFWLNLIDTSNYVGFQYKNKVPRNFELMQLPTMVVFAIKHAVVGRNGWKLGFSRLIFLPRQIVHPSHPVPLENNLNL